MVTTVGMENSFGKLVKNLLYLEHDAIAAYDAAIERLKDTGARQQIERFKGDHMHHLTTLEEVAREIGLEAPTGGDTKELLTTGKVKMGGIIGDSAIIKAMLTNEEDTVTAYERASQHKDARARSQAFFGRALSDEQRHRAWVADYRG